ncbi:MAG: hypothetical protein ACHP6I_00920 [Rickettsiales bacterium]
MNRNLEVFQAMVAKTRDVSKNDAITQSAENYVGFVKVIDASFTSNEQSILGTYFNENQAPLTTCIKNPDPLVTLFNCTGVTPGQQQQAVVEKYMCYYTKQALVYGGANDTAIADALPDCIFS